MPSPTLLANLFAPFLILFAVFLIPFLPLSTAPSTLSATPPIIFSIGPIIFSNNATTEENTLLIVTPTLKKALTGSSSENLASVFQIEVRSPSEAYFLIVFIVSLKVPASDLISSI